MRAVAETHRRTGAPIMVHTSAPHHTGLVAKQIFASEGVDLSRLLIAHSGDTTDMDYLHQLLDGGAYVGMDRFGLDILLATDERVIDGGETGRRGLREPDDAVPRRVLRNRLAAAGYPRASDTELALHLPPRLGTAGA